LRSNKRGNRQEIHCNMEYLSHNNIQIKG